MNVIIPAAEPFLLSGETSKPACLLIHGFTGTPKEMRWMGEYFGGSIGPMASMCALGESEVGAGTKYTPTSQPSSAQ